MIKRVIFKIGSINETLFVNQVHLYLQPLSSISAVRNKLVDIVRSKSCFWVENLLTLHTYH